MSVTEAERTHTGSSLTTVSSAVSLSSSWYQSERAAPGIQQRMEQAFAHSVPGWPVRTS